MYHLRNHFFFHIENCILCIYHLQPQSKTYIRHYIFYIYFQKDNILRDLLHILLFHCFRYRFPRVDNILIHYCMLSIFHFHYKLHMLYYMNICIFWPNFHRYNFHYRNFLYNFQNRNIWYPQFYIFYNYYYFPWGRFHILHSYHGTFLYIYFHYLEVNILSELY